MNVGVEIPKYVCNQTVRAAKITGFRPNGTDYPDLLLGEIGGVVSLLPEYFEKHSPHIGGYYVVDEDGYVSFLPEEEMYKRWQRRFEELSSPPPRQPEQAEQGKPVAKVVSTAPTRIWLNLGFEFADKDEISFDELDDVMWSRSNAAGEGIEYIRADLVRPQPDRPR